MSRFKGIMLIGLLFGIFLFLIILFVLPKVFNSKNLILGLTGRYTPENLPLNIIEDISDGLTTISKDGLVEPNLAESWSTPDKGKTWVFHLSNDTLWQDGTEITSNDINYQFTDVSVDRPDDKTIIFKLNDPFAPFPSVVSRPVFKTGFLGTGEWRVANVSLAGTYIQTLVLEKKGEGKRTYKL